MAVKVQVDLSGPFFQRDPAATFGENVRRMLDGIAQEGERAIQAALGAGTGRAPISLIGDRVAQHVVGRTRSLSGKRWAMTAVVSVNNSGWSPRQGVALMAAASTLERRFHPFRKTASQLRSARAVLAANLTRGIE